VGGFGVGGRERKIANSQAVAGSAAPVDASDIEFSVFFQEQFPGVVRTAFLIVHDRERARDIAQDAFIELYTRWYRISRYERPERWVRRVAIRSAVRALRRERIRPRLERELDPASLPKPIDIDVIRAVGQLSPAQRAAIVLFYFEDRSVAQVADMLSCSEVTAKVHLHRGRKRLAQLLGEPEPIEEARDVS
jgi:RNA polymerase sigma factor (sigma-70 family)